MEVDEGESCDRYDGGQDVLGHEVEQGGEEEQREHDDGGRDQVAERRLGLVRRVCRRTAEATDNLKFREGSAMKAEATDNLKFGAGSATKDTQSL